MASCWGCRETGERRSHWWRPWVSGDPESDKHLSTHRRSWGATEWPWGDLMPASSSPVAATVVRGRRLLQGSWGGWPLEASVQWPPLLGLTFCQFFENSLWGALAPTAHPPEVEFFRTGLQEPELWGVAPSLSARPVEQGGRTSSDHLAGGLGGWVPNPRVGRWQSLSNAAKAVLRCNPWETTNPRTSAEDLRVWCKWWFQRHREVERWEHPGPSCDRLGGETVASKSPGHHCLDGKPGWENTEYLLEGKKISKPILVELSILFESYII